MAEISEWNIVSYSVPLQHKLSNLSVQAKHPHGLNVGKFSSIINSLYTFLFSEMKGPL